MRSVLIGAVGSTEIILKAMHDAGYPPALLATLSPTIGKQRHGDYVDLSMQVAGDTHLLFTDQVSEADLLEAVRAVEPDVIFVIGWSQMVGPELRALAGKYCVGFHPTLLPSLRGRAAIGWTILLGLRETGATLFEVADGVDSGHILAQRRIPLEERENVGSLAAKLSTALDAMIRELLPRLADGTAEAKPQTEENVSYCARRTGADNRIDWNASQTDIDRLIRASSSPYSGAFTFTRKRQVTIWQAEPWSLPYPYHAAPGQIVDYVDGDPIVRCGDAQFLRIIDYDAGGATLAGQIRLRDALELSA